MKWAHRRKRKTKKSPAKLMGGKTGGAGRPGTSSSDSQAQTLGFFGEAMGIDDDQTSPPDRSDDERDAPSTPDNDLPDARTIPGGRDKDDDKGEEGAGANPDHYWDFLI